MLALQKGHLLVMYTNRCDASNPFMQAECFVGLHQVSVELRLSCSQIAGVTLIVGTVNRRRFWQPCQEISLKYIH